MMGPGNPFGGAGAVSFRGVAGGLCRHLMCIGVIDRVVIMMSGMAVLRSQGRGVDS